MRKFHGVYPNAPVNLLPTLVRPNKFGIWSLHFLGVKGRVFLRPFFSKGSVRYRAVGNKFGMNHKQDCILVVKFMNKEGVAPSKVIVSTMQTDAEVFVA